MQQTTTRHDQRRPLGRTLFVAWQDPVGRGWYPIGQLLSNHRSYVFCYTHGAQKARDEAGFSPLAGFPDLHKLYRSQELFPLFMNRLLRPSRPEYGQFVEWLQMEESSTDPVAILARTGGHRVTDTLEVFPSPQQLPSGEYEFHFFVHGLSHMAESSAVRAEQLGRDERLYLMLDFQNPHDPLALALRTSETTPEDMHILGYCPRYLRADFLKLMGETSDWPIVTVERVNPKPAPIQFRILCRIRMKWREGFQPFSGPEYQPLARSFTRWSPKPEAA